MPDTLSMLIPNLQAGGESLGGFQSHDVTGK